MGSWKDGPKDERVARQKAGKARKAKADAARAAADVRERERVNALQSKLKAECLARHPEWRRGSL